MKLSVYLDCLCDCIPRRRRAVHLPTSASARNRFDGAAADTGGTGNVAALVEHRRVTAAFMSSDEPSEQQCSLSDLVSAPQPAAPTPQCRCFHFIPADPLCHAQSVQPYFPWKPPSNQSFFPNSVLQSTTCMGFEFADGTSLPYVPVRNVTLHLRNEQYSDTRFKRRSSRSLAKLACIRLSMCAQSYTQLVQNAERAFRKSSASALSLPTAQHKASRVTVEVQLNPCAADVALQEDCMCTKLIAHYATLQSADLHGRALLMFAVPHEPASATPPLEIRLHRFQLLDGAPV